MDHAPEPPATSSTRSAARLSTAEATELAGQVAALAEAGLPLAPGLHAAAQEVRGTRVSQVLDRLAGNLDAGQSLDEAMTTQQNSFPPHMRSLILASVHSGRFAKVLQQLVAIEQRQAELRRRIWANLAYPVVLLIVVLLLLGLSVHWLIPQIAEISDELTGTSRTLASIFQRGGLPKDRPQIDTPVVIVHFLFWLTASVASVAVLLWSLAQAGVSAPWLRVLHALPLLGPLWRWSRMAQFARLMELLLAESTPLPQSLRLAGEAVRQADLAWACRQAAAQVEAGSALARSLADLPPFPPTLIPFLEWGQSTSNLAEAFRAAAEAFEGRVQGQVALLESVLMPATFLLIVGTLLILGRAIIWPLFMTFRLLSGGW